MRIILLKLALRSNQYNKVTTEIFKHVRLNTLIAFIEVWIFEVSFRFILVDIIVNLLYKSIHRRRRRRRIIRKHVNCGWKRKKHKKSDEIQSYYLRFSGMRSEYSRWQVNASQFAQSELRLAHGTATTFFNRLGDARCAKQMAAWCRWDALADHVFQTNGTFHWRWLVCLAFSYNWDEKNMISALLKARNIDGLP